MLLLPIGQEKTEVRREPWVTWALILLNVLVFLPMRLFSNEGERSERFRETGTQLVDYLAEHPYLQLPEDLRPLLAEEFVEELATGKAEMERLARVPIPWVVEREQKQLDALCDKVRSIRTSGLENRLGYVPAHPSLFTLFTCLFVHGGWAHIIGNLFLLLLAGPPVEDLFGRPLFVAVYLLGGVAATLTHALRLPGDQNALIGASGAIAAVMGAFLVRLGTTRIQFLFMPVIFIPIWRFRFWLPAFVVLPVWFLEQFVSAQIAPNEGIAWWAHVGGFLFGVAFAGGMRMLSIEERFVHPVIEGKIGITQHPALVAACDARTRGDLESARSEIGKVLAAEPGNLDARIEAYEIALAMQDGAEAGAAAARLLEMYLKQAEKELAADLIRDASERVGEALTPRFWMAGAGFFEREGDGRAALDLYARVASGFAADPAAFRALFRRGEILRKNGDARGARLAYQQALAHPACAGALREAVDKALAGL